MKKNKICMYAGVIVATLVLIVLGISIMIDKKSISITVKYGEKDIEVFNKEQSFEEIFKKLDIENLVYVKNNEEISINFNGEKPEKITAIEYILNDEGKYKYGKEKNGEEVILEWNKSNVILKVKPNIFTMFSSSGEDYNQKGILKGYHLVINYADKKDDYYFVIKGDAAITNQ